MSLIEEEEILLTILIFIGLNLNMGIVTQDPLAFTNVSGTSDIDGPKVETISAQVKDYTDMSLYGNLIHNSGSAYFYDAKTVLAISDESLATNDTSFPYGDQYYGDSYVSLGFSNFDADGNQLIL